MSRALPMVLGRVCWVQDVHAASLRDGLTHGGPVVRTVGQWRLRILGER